MNNWTEEHPKKLDKLIDDFSIAAVNEAVACQRGLHYDPAALNKAREAIMWFAYECATGQAPGATRLPPRLRPRHDNQPQPTTALRIFGSVCDAMQEAEELGGDMSAAEYIELMRMIAGEAEQRIANYRERAVEEAQNNLTSAMREYLDRAFSGAPPQPMLDTVRAAAEDLQVALNIAKET